MKKIVLLFISMIFLGGTLMAQSRAYTVKGGLTIGTQKWEGQDQDPLFSYHGAFSIESVSEEKSFGVFAQLGYHVKGSAWRNAIISNVGSSNFTFASRKFKFQNVALLLGFKKYLRETSNSKLYYLLGVRGDYTVDTNLSEYEDDNARIMQPVYPFDGAVRKFNYGVTAGAGTEFPFTEFVSGIIELSISPDFSNQYQQGAVTTNSPSQGLRNYGEKKFVNLVFEVSVGFRFLHKIEYID